MHSNRYTILFALLVCVTCSVILALAAGGLKSTIRKNEEFDVHRNILRVLNLPDSNADLTKDELEALYRERIREHRVDAAGKLIDPSIASGGDAGPKQAEGDQSESLPVFLRLDGDAVAGYCIPISGKGLWSTLYGYLAVGADGETVMGITFYKHGETPGLGGEVAASGFTDNFIGKKIFDENGKLTSITIAKGSISADVPEKSRLHTVDGISGATMTGNGVNVFLKRDLERYEPFLQAIRRGESPVVKGA